MVIGEKEYKKWSRMSMVIAEDDEYYAGEILQSAMEKIIIKMNKHPEWELTDNYVFISMKNTYLNLLDREKTRNKRNLEFDFEYQEYEIDNDIDITIRTTAIEECILKMNYFDKHLYILHFVNNMSQRRIAKEVGLSLSIIHERVKKIKSKIKEHYNIIKEEIDEKI